MRRSIRIAASGFAGFVALGFLATSDSAFAQKKKGSAQSKQAACVAKSHAENPGHFGKARQASYNRCMGR